MRRITLLFILLTSMMSVKAACNWSGYWMKKVNQQQNVYTFKTNLDKTMCIDYHWVVYDYQLKRSDTVSDFGGITQVQFNTKGKYRMSLKVVDECEKCDTSFNFEIDITVYGKANVNWWVVAQNCKSYTFEMTEFDTCVEYYYSIYKSKYFDTMSSQQWKNLTDSAIYFGYNFDEKDLVYYNMASQRTINHEFSDSGRHLLSAYWYNKCTGIDTWVMRKMEVCPRESSLGVTRISTSEPKLIGIYDMLGRRVYAIRRNEILIYIYDDGTRKKVVHQ